MFHAIMAMWIRWPTGPQLVPVEVYVPEGADRVRRAARVAQLMVWMALAVGR